MKKVFLFDWGDTLMVDYPALEGKMCDWHHVESVEGAHEALSALSQENDIYIATSAAESNEDEIKAAFKRVDLDAFISGYFCFSNLKIKKGDPRFLPEILNKLGVLPENVTMVGDTWQKDIQPALDAGINAVWLYRENKKPSLTEEKLTIIHSLSELHK
ncbi:HAD hydrolase-like protein [Vibrio sp. Of7-15]|uniref:HAD family hydrolase n=1 Tax=Vibrio sp. Of7-15 TaxID=2724879 RepID=UPI001EF1BAE7|nr:HAD hydrolase-like protein [Vibrio sp. Of7-15]MCG7496568.1 HAD hydrolase-like protein [Vibrio sp. Of7-15]